ncbi:hypothetical protein Kfla_1854 [Kribbella flavida DSM 17836]|uniref:Endonuclease/exonuclease/phosphatase domain-containing protein n=1 Tax=Kribbella flavida (strain DSM 17836 / JCM 10339 / NBRC 14399) TaxID=479435 RepID=D2PPI6_KRIFD|nr:hypothetical protein [Kribbella flavida]ADB30948.1 hypothetical protein Kfla_1854 [Kribbella flavida DSM 17836]
MAGRISRRQALVLGGGALVGATTLGSVSGARSASAASEWVRLPVITANIGRADLGAREAAIRAVRNGDPGHRPIVGWQEIREGDTGEPAMISQYFGDLYQNAFLHHDTSYRVPISAPQPWKVVNSRATFVHGGIAGVTPPRWINEIVAEHQAHPGLKFVLINTHYIAGAYNGNQNPNLRDEWDLHKKTHRERVMAHHGRGHLVIWTADTNRPDFDKATGQDTERKAFAHGIDRINWLPGDGTVQLDLLSTRTIPMNVDGHDARAAIFRIRLA